MTTRLDLAIQKHPDHEAGLRLLATRDPSGNLKYIDWGAKILASGQALAPEVADVLDLFHRFVGVRFGKQLIQSDIYTYRPHAFAGLRDSLNKIKRATDRKRKKREALYRIEGSIEADVVYDSPDLIVRHIKNKPASAHYGLGTRWCISMLREGYFEDYEAHNATFFFFERKSPVGDEFDKVALMLARNAGEETTAFTSADRRVDMMILAKVHGLRVFDIFREVYDRSVQWPGSVIFQIHSGTATKEQLESVFASVVSGELKLSSSYDTDALMEAICCNDASPLVLLAEVSKRAEALSRAAWKRSHVRSRRGRRIRRMKHSTKELVKVILSAMFIHPAVPMDARAKLAKELRRRKVVISNIHRTNQDGRVGVSYLAPSVGDGGFRRIYRARRFRRRQTLSGLRAYVGQLERRLIQTHKRIDRKMAAEAKKTEKMTAKARKTVRKPAKAKR